jgi:glycerol-3-phosphate dehydrogenase
LCEAAGRYFRAAIEPAQVVHALTGVNAVRAGQGPDKDGGIVLMRRGGAPLLAVFGGDVTTARWRAERTVDQLTPFYPMAPRWTARQTLPGGNLAGTIEAEAEHARDRWPHLDEPTAQRMVRAYGARLGEWMGEAQSADDMGAPLGGDLTAREVRHLMTREWARFADDVIWRRTQAGLSLSPQQRDALALFMASASQRQSDGVR